MKTDIPIAESNMRRGLIRVIAYHVLWFVSAIGLLLAGHLPAYFCLPAYFIIIPLLWFSTRPSFPLKRDLPDRPFTLVENWVWYSGAVICSLVLLGCALGTGTHSTPRLLTFVAFGCASWAFVFLCFRDCRYITRRS